MLIVKRGEPTSGNPKKSHANTRNGEYIIAIEVLWCRPDINFTCSGKRGKGTELAYSTIRKAVPMLKEGRVLSQENKRFARKRIILNEIKKTLRISY